MTPTVITLVLGALGSLMILVSAGIFIKRGTVIKTIDVMDKVIAAYGVAEKLEEQKMTALAAQLRITQAERDALATQLSEADARMRRLENSTSTWVLERATLLKAIDKLQAQNRDQEERIGELEARISQLTAHQS